MLRFIEPIPQGLEREGFTPQNVQRLIEFLRSLELSLNALQGTPQTPSIVQAGTDSDTGTDQAAAASDHIHAAETAAPSNYVQLGGDLEEGGGSAFMRASARNVLTPGTDDGDLLVWDGNEDSWESISLSELDGVAQGKDAMQDILLCLQDLTLIVKEGLNVRDDPDQVRRAYDGASSVVLQELQTLTYFFLVGLNVPGLETRN